MKNFAITGVAGYIAPRHLQAIKDTGNKLVAAVDPHDSVGIMDRYFPEASFFTEFERFDRHLERLRRGPESERVHYLTICSPNFLHDAHIRMALRIGADAICEKPLVLNPWNLDALEELERESGNKVHTILQLRVHPSLIAVKQKLEEEGKRKKEKGKSTAVEGTIPSEIYVSKKHEVILTYITSRGLWYDFSWKGVKEKSGGIATNIGIHFFDLLIWLFGSVQTSRVNLAGTKRMSGFMELENANVRWFLSIDRDDLPQEEAEKGKTTFRSISVDGEEIQFSEGFTDLHTKVYEETLAGRGFGIEDARPSITLVQQIRNAEPRPDKDTMHPFSF
ncbi:MAG: Gfo/Idh/MocA family oxidoreductase [Ignavibacteriales bacterium]